jgi:hypothetical protein
VAHFTKGGNAPVGRETSGSVGPRPKGEAPILAGTQERILEGQAPSCLLKEQSDNWLLPGAAGGEGENSYWEEPEASPLPGDNDGIEKEEAVTENPASWPSEWSKGIWSSGVRNPRAAGRGRAPLLSHLPQWVWVCYPPSHYSERRERQICKLTGQLLIRSTFWTSPRLPDIYKDA